jgi:hypothetical protein
MLCREVKRKIKRNNLLAFVGGFKRRSEIGKKCREGVGTRRASDYACGSGERERKVGCGQDATALEQRMTALLKHDLYRSCICCSYF